jgi:DNA-binding PadR family transcriptional regulator
MFFELAKWWCGGFSRPSIRDYLRARRGFRLSYFRQPSGIRITLLSLLKGRPKRFHELMRRLKGREGGTAKTLYPALQRLCDEGLVHVDAEHGKRTYRLSSAGEAELRGTTPEVQDSVSAKAAGFEERQALVLDARVARFAAHVTGAAVRVARMDSHAYGRILKVCEILARTKHEIEKLGKS